uniref:Uncharacterized protein n=1 Tax=Eptatretus burgeri TaxID=7764 RepID=A0A8C4N9Z6_EPTBU
QVEKNTLKEPSLSIPHFFSFSLLSQRICGSNYPLSIVFVVVTEFCERFSFYGMKALHDIHCILFFCSLSLRCWFNRTIIYLSIVYVIGHVVKTIGAVPIIGDGHTALAVVGLVFIAFGTGGIKPCVAAFGGDQFEAHQVSMVVED